MFHDLLSNGFTGKSISHLALEVKPAHLTSWRAGGVTTVSLYATEHLRVFLSTSPERLEGLLRRENQGLLSTALTVDQLWDRYRVNWFEVRRLEMELGEGGDHNQAYTWNLPPSGSQVLAWMKLRTLREQGALKS